MFSRSTTHFRRFRLPVFSLSILAVTSLVGCSPFASSPLPARGESRDQTVRLQVFLDSKNFGPGVVDGRRGEFTRKALALYQSANGLPPESIPDTAGIQPYTTYTIAPEDLSTLGTMASEPTDVAKQSRSPYTTLIELLSERFHTSQTFLRKLNPGVDVNSLTAGGSLLVPNVRRPFRADRFPSGYPAGSAVSGRTILVNTSMRILEIRDAGKLVAAFPITPGSTEHPAPLGEWRVVGAVPWPWYRYDEGVLKRGERTDTFYNLPPGPNSPVGIVWAGLNRPGVGIHGTTTPDTIGRAGSHGCIRLSNWDAATFYTYVRKGVPVTIR